MNIKYFFFLIFILLFFININYSYAQVPPTCNDNSCEISIDNTTNNTVKDESYYKDLISGKDIKNYTVESLAQFFQIPAEELANALGKYLNKNIKPSDSLQILHDNYELSPSVIKDIATKIALKQNIDFNAIKTEENNKEHTNYHTLEIISITVLLYLISWLLYKFKKISLLTHQKFWNYILTITFIASAVLGILLAIRTDKGFPIPLPTTFSGIYWHVITGIIATTISIFHIAWHWYYYIPQKWYQKIITKKHK